MRLSCCTCRKLIGIWRALIQAAPFGAGTTDSRLLQQDWELYMPTAFRCVLDIVRVSLHWSQCSRWRKVRGSCKAHVSVLHLRDDLQIPLGGVCQVALLCSVGIDARAILRPSVIALPVLHAGVDLPPEDLQEVLVCHQRRVVRHLRLLKDSAPVSANTLGRSS